jgi:hypothetical protein
MPALSISVVGQVARRRRSGILIKHRRCARGMAGSSHGYVVSRTQCARGQEW